MATAGRYFTCGKFLCNFFAYREVILFSPIIKCIHYIVTLDYVCLYLVESFTVRQKSQLCGGRNGHFYAFKNVKCTTTTLLNEHFTYYIALFGGIENVSGLCEPNSKLERSMIVPYRSKLFRGFNLATREF